MRTSGSKLLTFTCLLSVSSFLFHRYLLNDGLPSMESAAPAPKNVTVLLWHWPFGRAYSLDGDKCREMYNISHCLLSDNRSTFSDADVVVFHHHELQWGHSLLPLRLLRPPTQHWVWLSMEPPVKNVNLASYNGLFNWTMSYRRDADISIPYGRTLPTSASSDYLPPRRNRSCLVSWVVSRYESTQARAAVYQSLREHIPIEVYGHWPHRPLSDEQLLPTIGSCYFYLAFENSEARDYVSEKLWRNAFQAGAVPVVLGPSRATYEALAPPGSFIHVEDFRGVAELAGHLRRVAADRRRYEEYFRWRGTHRIQTYTEWRERLCQICVRYSRLAAHKVYRDLDIWVNS